MISRVVCAFCLTFVAPSLPAAELTVRVTTPDGMPLNQAVVTVTAPGAQSPSDEAPVAVIDQVNTAFVPHVSVVRRGTLVEFPNSDETRHHVYSFSPANTFELPLYHDAPAEPVEFNRAGIVTLACNIHDWMLAYVYVTDAEHATVTDDGGTARLSLDSTGPWTVTVWHPNLGVDSEGVTQQVSSSTEALDVIINAPAVQETRRLRRGSGRYR